MRRYVAVFIITALLIAFLPGNTIAARAINVTLNDKKLSFDVSPVLEDGRLLVPLRAIFEALGATINWDSATSTVKATKDGDTVKITVDKKTAYRNNTSVELGVSAKVVKGRMLVPIRFVFEALGAEVEWDAKSQMVTINQKDELELQAREKVKQYLSLLDRAVSESVNDEEWNGILSQTAIKSGYGNKSRVFKPKPVVDSQVRSVSNVVIMKAEYANEPENDTVIIVTAQYIYNDPTEPDAPRQKIQYEKEYSLVWENGQLVIDSERTLELRHSANIPLISLSEKDIEQIKQRWQQDNYYTYNDILAINNNFISSTLMETFGIIKWGNTSTPSIKGRLEHLLSYFTVDVKESNGWKDFISLDAKRDPTFTVLWATSEQDHISATLYAELYPGFNTIPALLEVEIKKQYNGKEWLFTRIEKVRGYTDLSELEQKEPQSYDMLIEMDNYRRMLNNQ